MSAKQSDTHGTEKNRNGKVCGDEMRRLRNTAIYYIIYTNGFHSMVWAMIWTSKTSTPNCVSGGEGLQCPQTVDRLSFVHAQTMYIKKPPAAIPSTANNCYITKWSCDRNLKFVLQMAMHTSIYRYCTCGHHLTSTAATFRKCWHLMCICMQSPRTSRLHHAGNPNLRIPVYVETQTSI